MFDLIWSTIATGLAWIVIAYLIACMAVAAYALGAMIWHDSVKPRLIPSEEIARLADEIAANHSDDPDHAAYRELEAAWWKSDGAEQVKWKRVLKEIRRRELDGTATDR